MTKKDFPIFQKHPDLVYLDSAATTQKPQVVIDRIKKFYEEENANVHRGIYSLSELATKKYEDARKTVASFTGAGSEREIIFTSGTTDSINIVASCWLAENLEKGDTVLATQMEHHSNFIPFQQVAKKYGAKMELVKVKDYRLDLDDLREKLQMKPKLLAVTYVSNVLGTMNFVKEIVQIKNEISPDTVIVVDAAQSVAHMTTVVVDLGVDFLAYSGHKMYGPTGIGVLWAREELLQDMKPFRYGGGMIRNVEVEDSEWADLPEKFEGGTPNIAGAIGLAEAIKYIRSVGFENILVHEEELTDYALECLKEINEVEILGLDKSFIKSGERKGVISIYIKDIHPHDIAQILNDNNIAVRAGHHCNQILMKEVLKVPATVRISLGVYNSKNDIDKLVEGIGKVTNIFGIV